MKYLLWLALLLTACGGSPVLKITSPNFHVPAPPAIHPLPHKK